MNKCKGCKWEGNERVCKACNATENSAAVSPANVERAACDEPVAKKEGPRFDTPCNIHVHSRTNRLSDADGRSIKALIDGIVGAGILADDNAKFVNKTTQSQETAKGRGEETTVIIEWDMRDQIKTAEVHDLAQEIL